MCMVGDLEITKTTKEITIEEKQTITTLEALDLARCYVPETIQRKSKIDDVEQTGANCGCFAFGMAIWNSLTKMEKNAYLKIVDKQKPRNEPDITEVEMAISYLALKFQLYATNNGLSSVGEFFSAETFVTAINKFAEEMKIPFYAEKKTFSTSDRLKRHVEKESLKQNIVLIPYFAEKDKGGDTTIDPSKMYYAHWAMLVKEGEKYRLYEGNKIEKESEIDIDDLARWNLKLAKTFNIDSYLRMIEGNKNHDEQEEGFRNRKKWFDGKEKSLINQETDGMIEQADLNGCIVVINRVNKQVGNNETDKKKV